MENRLNHPRMLRGTALLFLTLVVAGVVAGIAGRSGSSAVSSGSSGALNGELTGPAPWPANWTGVRARLSALHLPALAREGTVLHTHEHLDLFVSGTRVTVPAGIGIDPYGTFISPIHTHDATGIIHVESPTVRTFTLGEFFGVWGLRFDNGCLGGYCAGGRHRLRVFADGVQVADPAQLPLTEHEEIVVAFGAPRRLPSPIPSRYAFPPGL